MLYTLEIVSHFEFGKLPCYIGDVFPYIFNNKGGAIFGIFQKKKYVEDHKHEMEEALKNVYISIYKNQNFEQELVCMLDNITLNILEIPFNIEKLEKNRDIYYIVKNNDMICEYNTYHDGLNINDFISLSKMYIENNEKKCLFEVYKMRLDHFYPITNQGRSPIYEFYHNNKK